MFVPDGVQGLWSDGGLINLFDKTGFLPVVNVLLANLQRREGGGRDGRGRGERGGRDGEGKERE